MRGLLVVGLLIVTGLFMGCTSTDGDPVSVTRSFSYTATGDDGMLGQAAYAQIRMARTSDSLLNNWTACQIVSDTVPWQPGITDTLQVDFLIETGVVYYFGIKIGDEVPNWSDLSNVIAWTAPDVIAPLPVGDFGFAD